MKSLNKNVCDNFFCSHMLILISCINVLSFFPLPGTVYTTSPETATLLGLVKRVSTFTPVQVLKDQADFQ